MSNRLTATPAHNLKRRDYVAALARGLAVMQAFANQNEYLTLSEVAKLTQMSRASVRRCLLTLESLGYMEARGKFFRLAPRVLGLTRAYLSSSLLPRVAQPVIEKVSETIGESCSVSILHGDDIIYVARSTARRHEPSLLDVGAHLPAYCTSMGRVLLASLPDAELDAFLKRVELRALTPFTITDRKKLKRVILKVREEGMCLGDQEVERDLRAIAVPVLNRAGRVVAAMHAIAPAGRVGKPDMTGVFLPVLRRAAAEMRPLLIGAA